MKEPRLSKAETRVLEQYWKLGTASVREVLESLPESDGQNSAVLAPELPLRLTRSIASIVQ